MQEVNNPDTAEQPELATFGRERPAPGAYYLDLSTLVNYPVKDNGQPSTFRDIYCKLRDARTLKMPEPHATYEDTYETDTGEVTISGSLFVLSELRQLIDLERQGVDPYKSTWFYYDHDWSCDGDELYSFFLVHDGKIVRDRVSFMHCDPRVLTKNRADDRPIWRSEPHVMEAWDKYWYKKFYTETVAGQLMVLRPDEPILYHYDRAVHDVTRDLDFVTRIKTYRLLWVAVPLLAAIAFPALRPYMAAVAILALAEWLWKWWAGLKIGR